MATCSHGRPHCTVAVGTLGWKEGDPRRRQWWHRYSSDTALENTRWKKFRSSGISSPREARAGGISGTVLAGKAPVTTAADAMSASQNLFPHAAALSGKADVRVPGSVRTFTQPLAVCTAFVLAEGPCGAGFGDGLERRSTPRRRHCVSVHTSASAARTNSRRARGQARPNSSASISDPLANANPTACMADRRMRQPNAIVQQITSTVIRPNASATWKAQADNRRTEKRREV